MKKLVLFAASVALLAASAADVAADEEQGDLQGEFSVSFPDTVDYGGVDEYILHAHIISPTTHPVFFGIRFWWQSISSTQVAIAVPASDTGVFDVILPVTLTLNMKLGDRRIDFIVEEEAGTRIFDHFAQTDTIRVVADHDLDGSGSFNIADVTRLIKFIFAGGDAPLPGINNADANCDERVNIADITSLISFIFAATSDNLPCHR